MGVQVVGGPGGGSDVLSTDPATASERLAALFNLIPSVHTSTKLQFSLGSGDFITFTGIGLGQFNAHGVPQSGTVTGLTITENGVVESTSTGVSLSMQTLWSAVTSAHGGNPNAAVNLFNQIFAGNDTFTSNSAGSLVGDTFLGGAGNDTFNMANSAPGSRVYGGDGNDTFNFGAKFQASDTVDGGTGTDTLNLDGGHTTAYYNPTTAPSGPPGVQAHGLLLGATSLTNVEQINLAAGSSYGLIFNNANVAHGAVLTISGSALSSTNSLYINGAQLISGGALNVTGGSGASTLIGGSGNDTLTGGAGADLLDGGPGNDVLNGGKGVNTASYADATSSVAVSLQTTKPQNTMGAGTDTLTNIQNLIGSNFADFLTAGNSGSVLNGGNGPDILVAGPGADTLIGGGGDDEVNYTLATSGVTVSLAISGAQHTGGSGTDTLTGINILEGSNYNDVLTAAVSGNQLYGAGGNDTLIAGPGSDYLDGGTGTNTAVFSGHAADYSVTPSGPDFIINGDGQSATVTNIQILQFSDEQMVLGSAGGTLTARAAGDKLLGRPGNDTLNGGAGNDVLIGGGGKDTLNGGGGTNTADFTGNASAYTITENSTTTTVKGASGTETLTNVQVLQFANEQMVGLAAGGTLTAHSGGDTLVGGAGNDTLVAGSGSDVINGGAGVDMAVFNVGPASDYVIHQGGGTTTVTGDGQSATITNVEVLEFVGEQTLLGSAAGALTARPAGDTLVGGPGNDTLTGGAGNDTLIGGGGNDKLNGGGGTNTAVFSGDYSAYHITTNGGVTTVKGPDGTDTLQKVQILQFADTLAVVGSTGETLFAENNVQTLIGGSGADTLRGGLLNDTLIGGAGQDTLSGGLGNNTFVFKALSDSLVGAADTITDWHTGDKINLSAIDADTTHSGLQLFHFGATAGHTGDIVVTYDSVHNRTVVDLYVNADNKPDAEIWLTGHQTLSASDFVL